MEKLQAELKRLLSRLNDADDFRLGLDNIISVYPFNEYEYVISTLLGRDVLTLDEYYILRDEYIARNLYLPIFEISAPRGFGELWAQGHLKELAPDLVKPTRLLEANYKGQYDFLLDGNIRIEVKASRAVAFRTDEPLYVKALAFDSTKQFDMNFQQIKPACCDVFVWIGVWRDVIRYWILASREVTANRYYSVGQHRGNIGEGQLHIKKENIGEFVKYEHRPNELLQAIRDAYTRQTFTT
ncbi:MAG: hypothetical protein MSG64_19850 [Pyrinomonadaceae bacterium MAG19_C2-C3]|nr:hypothetical protein [Pyrinomonadaceae bacterium MAG19_C2-C3]